MKGVKHSSLWLFLIGLGSATKIYLGGAISFTEIVVFGLAPFFAIRHYGEYKRMGFLPVLIIPLLMIVGCFISCQYNNVSILAFIKCAMMYYSIFAFIVVFYWVIKNNLKGIGWFYLGVYLSQIISIFAFDPRIATDGISTELMVQLDLETQMTGVLFWYPKIIRLLYLPIQGMYFSIPIIYSIASPVIAALVAIFTSVSGRGAAALCLVSFALIAYCRKSRKRMKSIGRYFVVFVLFMGAVAMGIKSLYSYSARAGLLGVEAMNKYHAQTWGDNSFLRILIGGRTEFFIAIRAMLDHPIIGVGPYAIDKKGYSQDFILKYGTQFDIEEYQRKLRLLARKGIPELLPQHSVITQFWGCSGIMGLIFCLYYLYLVYLYFRKYVGSVPQWFGWMMIAIPSSLFTLFFNPYGDRAGFPFLITCILISRCVGRGLLLLPYDMEMEARKYD